MLMPRTACADGSAKRISVPCSHAGGAKAPVTEAARAGALEQPPLDSARALSLPCDFQLGWS